MSKAYTPRCSDVVIHKFSESNVEGLYIEKMAICGETGEPLTDDDGHAVVETYVNVGITRGLFDLLLWQWALFGTMLVAVLYGNHNALINLGCTLGFILMLFMQKYVVKQIKNVDISPLEVKSSICTLQ